MDVAAPTAAATDRPPEASIEGERVQRARRGLSIYLGVVVVVTACIQVAMIRTGRPIEELAGLVFALMWTPTLASVVARVVLREGVRDVSFRLGGLHGLRNLGLAWLCPVLVGAVAYGGAWLSGLEQLSVPEFRPLGPGPSPLAHASARFLFAAVLNVPLAALSAAGEEFGWRGYMLTRLIAARVPRPILVSGLLWGAWHLPLILSGQYAAGPYPLLSALVFLVSVTAAGFVAARVRLDSGSVWPAVMFHAAWNSIIQGFFDRLTVGGGASHTQSVWIGESGLLVVSVSWVFVLVLRRSVGSLRQFPADPGEPLRLA